MSSSVIIGDPYSVQTFDLYALRFTMVARRSVAFLANGDLVRGRLGMVLHNRHPEIYKRLFRPRVDSGPSGLLDSPRPFVLRVRHLDRIMIEPGQRYEIGLHLFETGEPPIEIIGESLAEGLMAECIGVEGKELLRVRLAPPEGEVRRVRVRFLTPTELKAAEIKAAQLKPSDQLEFSVLLARMRDRVSTLRALYGAGPLEIDFRAMGQRASRVRMTHCELQHVAAERVSRATGQRHSLGGFVGVAEYEGELAEFVPYLEIARWTGVGRQTVWGKGEIAWEII
jgi:hypothetical protein